MNMKLSTKIIGGYVIVALITLLVGLVGWFGISTEEKLTNKIVYAQSIEKQLLQREIDHLNWARKVGEFQRNEGMTELTVEKDAHKCGFGKWYYSEDRKKAEDEMPEIRDALRSIEAPHLKLHQSAEELETILKKGKDFRAEALRYYDTEVSRNLKDVQSHLGEIRPLVERHTSEFGKKAQIEAKRTGLMTLAGIVVGTLGALILGIVMSISITRPLNRIISGLEDASGHVAEAASEVSSVSQGLAESTTEQAASLEETSASMEELSSMTKQNADHTEQVKVMMAEARRIVEKVNNNMNNMAAAITEMTISSEHTGKIVKTIDEIAFHTNLLALNAAVEAARSQEAGAGFAVVAEEVRNLARRAAEAAKNTSRLIEDTIKNVKQGDALTHLTRDAFQENVKISGKIGDLVDEIAASSKEQSGGIEQVNKAVAEMDKVTQQTASTAEESAAVAEELNAQAEQMKGFVRDLTTLVCGRVQN
ncbi:MAG: methyl-accepting chemotaxis protein [Syntrophales bacterium]|nr:methyl-accepting chemotaxis protein [Syntrophales bacterium]